MMIRSIHVEPYVVLFTVRPGTLIVKKLDERRIITWYVT